MIANSVADEIDDYLHRLFPIPRSLTGEGNRRTFKILEEIVPLEITEYPSGTSVYDWTVPDEWVINDAYIKGPDGERLVDYHECNLQIVSYSTPIHQEMSFSELMPHLHVLESSATAIPYRTSYYDREWGFCVSQVQYQELEATAGLFEVCIDSALEANGSMTVGEICIPGEIEDEYLISTYCCHPSMANDNLSGLLATAFLARDLFLEKKPRCTWRFIFVPETIGAIAYLWHNRSALSSVRGGLVVTTCGGPGPFGYKQSFLGNHLVDRAVNLVFRDIKIDPITYPFAPDGSDERQYSSPGFRIPVVTITKDKYYEYPEYHTSLDNLDFVNGRQIAETLALYRAAIKILDSNNTYLSTVQFGEPQLGRRNLYPPMGGAINQSGAKGEKQATQDLDAITWLLFLSDGQNDLLTIAERSEISFDRVIDAANILLHAGLLEPVAA